MMMGMVYGASWSMPLTLRIVASMFLTPFAAFALFVALRVLLDVPVWLAIVLAAVPVALAVVYLVRAIRGFVLTRDAVFVRHLFWSSCEPLDGLVSVQIDETAMDGVKRLRTLIGGFGTGGWFWSARFGRFRGYLTNERRVVVLKLERGVIMFSPDDPDAFVRHIESFRPPPPLKPAR
jgi:hypothetical protein